MRTYSWLLITALAAVFVCAAAAAGAPFGKSPEGTGIELFTLKNARGMEARIMTWGATVVSLRVPDSKGRLGDIVNGFDNAESYFNHGAYFGALIGRYGNRVAKARFTLDGREYKLYANDGANSLHGGKRGFDKRVWTPIHVDDHSVELRYLSRDGEEGYPGNLTVTVRYTVTPENELRIDYTATTDKDTVLNLTNHSYFNLAGAGNGTILDEEIEIHASKFSPVDAGLIPLGRPAAVAGTPMDFRKPMKIGARIDSAYDQLKLGKGYDHNYVLDRPGDGLAFAARVYDPRSGRVMEVLTTQPGVQFYTGNFLDGTLKGKEGKVYIRRSALCLETQHFPDSPNKPEYPATELKPGATFRSTTVYRFSTRK